MGIDSISGRVAPARLERVEGFPDHLLDAAASDLWRYLPGPTLFEVAGRQGGPLFLSVLLHGNEDSGWCAVQAVLRRHRGALLPRPLLLFVGNVAAAKARVRTLPEQEDYNRTWPGTAEFETPLARLMREVVAIVRTKSPFASIDIHNNSGHNPHYACVNGFDEAHLHLARLFGRTVVYFERPLGVQSGALAPICPAVTVECGRAGEPASVAHAAELIEAALALQHFPEHPVPEHDIDLMRTFAIIKVPADASFSYDGADADFRFRADLDHLNFSELDPGVVFGRLGSRGKRLDIQPANDLVVADRYFEYAGDEITLVQRAIPAMLTIDPIAVRLDCLGYLMHRIDRNGRRIPE
jgi:Succinylglutamate desuccinylase / Aspartoacylase family